jgi:hypothetical protein
MSASAIVPILAQLIGPQLPDDVLRIIAGYMPPSGLLVLVRCNKRIELCSNAISADAWTTSLF